MTSTAIAPESQRESPEVVAGLGRLLADTFTLYLKSHNFHWNVSGPRFRELHLMFEEQYNELWLATDLIAERIRALGEHAPATYTAFQALTAIDEPDGTPSAAAMVEQLLADHETTVRTAQSVFPVAEAKSDQVTMDLLIQRMQFHEKTAWMLRSITE